MPSRKFLLQRQPSVVPMLIGKWILGLEKGAMVPHCPLNEDEGVQWEK